MKTVVTYNVKKIQVETAKSLETATGLQTAAEAINKAKEFSSSRTSSPVEVKYEKPFPEDTASEEKEDDTVNFLGWSYGY